MPATSPRVLNPGDLVNPGPVCFRFTPSIPDIVDSTTSEPPGFHWQWMLFGRIFEGSSGSMQQFDGAMMCGKHRDHFYALALPESDSGVSLYQDVELRLLKMTTKQKKALFGKPRVAMASLELSSQFGMVAEVANRLSPAGEPDRTDRLGDFCREYGMLV